MAEWGTKSTPSRIRNPSRRPARNHNRTLLTQANPLPILARLIANPMIRYAVLFISGAGAGYLFASIKHRMVEAKQVAALKMDLHRLTVLHETFVTMVDNFERKTESLRQANRGTHP